MDRVTVKRGVEVTNGLASVVTSGPAFRVVTIGAVVAMTLALGIVPWMFL